MLTLNNLKSIVCKAIYLILLWSLLCVFSSVHFDTATSFKVLCYLIFIVTLIRPLWGIGLFLILLPFFGGSKPQDLHTVRFITLMCTVTCASGLHLFYLLVKEKREIKLNLYHPLIFALFIYWLVSLLSLVSVFPSHDVLSIIQFRSPLTRNFLNLPEAHNLYSWLAFFVLTISMVFGLLIVNLINSSRQMITLIQCFLVGLLITVFLGLLDYFDVLNLNSIRPWYFLAYGENYRFLHLTSVFGNPSWYAQYLVLGAPALMTVLSINWPKKWKIVTLICLMAITEFCILLIFQRGGWISYPLTLIIIWYGVYVIDAEKQHYTFKSRAMGASLTKILITLPVTLAISLSLIYIASDTNKNSTAKLSNYVDRGKAITRTNDRLKFWEPTYLMLRLNPILGTGLESFSSQYEKLYVAPGHKYVQTAKNDVEGSYGSAHNLYFQALSGKGLLGLISLLGVMFASISLVWRGVLKKDIHLSNLEYSKSQKILQMITLAYTFALAIYGNVGEIFYSPNGYILFVLFYSAMIGATTPSSYNLSRNFITTVLVFIGCAFLFHLYWLSVSNTLN
jgi:O-antigen ligase